MRHFTLDFETASGINIKEVGAWRYSEDITTEILSLSYGFYGEKPYTWIPKIYTFPFDLELSNPQILFDSHGDFEIAIWRNIMMPQYGWPDIPNERWDNTQAICAIKTIPLKLEKAALALRLPYKKDTEGSKITMALSKPNKKGFYDRTSEKLDRVYEYNRRDILTQSELRHRLGVLPDNERKVWLLDQKINQRGIPLDMEFVAKAQEIVNKASIPLLAEFRELTNGLNPGQHKKILGWINKNGFHLKLNENDKESLNKEIVGHFLGLESDNEDDDLINIPDSLHTIPANVRRALEIRSLIGSASIKKLSRMSQCVNMDGRARGLFQYHGASTGRWAGRLLQPHNFPRGTLKDINGKKITPDVIVDAIMTGDPDFVQMTVGNPIETVISSLRHAIKTSDNHELFSGDFAGIEARIVLALAGQHDKIAIMAAGKSAYIDMGVEIYKRVIDKEIDSEEYQLCKNTVLGLGFQQGWQKFQAKYAKTKSDEFCQNVVNTYRKVWAPLVPEVWYGLGYAALETVKTLRPHNSYGVEYRIEEQFLTARLHSGRKLYYFQPKLDRKAMPWDKDDIRLCVSYMQMKKGQLTKVYPHGGTFTENVVSGLARDKMVDSMFKLEDNNFPIILTVHDEIVSEQKKGQDLKVFKQIMEDNPQWVKELMVPISVDCWSGNRYKK